MSDFSIRNKTTAGAVANASANANANTKKVAAFLLLTIVALATTTIDGVDAFVAIRHRRSPLLVLAPPLRGAIPSVGYEYIPPNPDASPGSYHTPSLRSGYPPDIPASLRGEAVRSALVTTERCIGWNLSTNEETSAGGLLEISGRGTLEFLNGKLTRDFRKGVSSNNNGNNNSYRKACLLDAKGRLVDVLRLTMVDDNCRALVLTSPGHSSADLLKRLDPFVFPMDEVALTNFCSSNNDDNDKNNHRSFSFSLASTQYKHVQKAMQDEQANLPLASNEMVFPTSSEGVVWKSGNDDVQILVLPSTEVPSVACVGYTFVFFGSGSSAALLGQRVWEHLVGEENAEGPIEAGALEYETMRIEAGQPAYGHEFGIDRAKLREEEEKKARETSAAAAATPDENKNDGSSQKRKKKKSASSSIIKTSPFELHFDSLIDLDKGCYLGQEGVASVLKNPRGAPRTLYTVVFDDDFNVYEPQSRGDKSAVENLTTLPKPGQKLFALGSNEGLQVGTLTSMGEAGGTGSAVTIGLALVRRPNSIRKKMAKLGLKITRDADEFLDVDFSSGSGIIQPPPMDPLDGLEVIVEGTFTMGVLKSVPSRQSGARRNTNMYDPDIEVEGMEEHESGTTPFSASTGTTAIDDNYYYDDDDDGYEDDDDDENESCDDDADDDDDDDSLEQIEAEMAKATAEAETAATEAKRKTEKMELLKKRAEEALARRKQNKAKKEEQASATAAEEEDAVAAEAKRKAEKMAMLKKRADEAMARRKQKKAEQ